MEVRSVSNAASVRDHTNSLVGLFAKGDAGRTFARYADDDPVHGRHLDDTELAEVLFRTLCS